MGPPTPHSLPLLVAAGLTSGGSFWQLDNLALEGFLLHASSLILDTIASYGAGRWCLQTLFTSEMEPFPWGVGEKWRGLVEKLLAEGGVCAQVVVSVGYLASVIFSVCVCY